MTSINLKTTAAGVLALVVLAAAGLAADRAINETRKVDPDARISIENLAGQVDVTGWDRGEVEITGTLDPKAEELRIEGGGNSLSIEVKYPRMRNLNIHEGSQLTIKVPRGCNLAIETVSADVTVGDVRGRVGIETVSGEVKAQGTPAGAVISSVSGTIAVELAGGTAQLEAVSGDIVARGGVDEFEAATVSGAVELTTTQPVRRIKAESVSGSLEIAAAPAPNATWELSCHSGSVDLLVPANLDADFDIETFSGDIRDDFGHEAERTSKYAPGRELNFTQGKGGADISIECFSGDVVIRKK